MSKQVNDVSSGLMIPFGLVFLAASLFVTIRSFWCYFQRSQGQHWVAVPCQIEQVKLVQAGRSRFELKNQVSYSYLFDGEQYQGDRVSFRSDESTEESQRIYDELSQYVPDSPHPAKVAAFRCYVDATSPSSSVLYPELGGSMNFGYVLLAWSFPAFGAGMMLSGVRGLKRGIAFSAAKAQHPDQPWLWSPDWMTLSIPEVNPLPTKKIYLFTIWSGFTLALFAFLGWLNDALTEGLIPWLIFLGFWCIPARMAWVRLRHRARVGRIHFLPTEIPSSIGQFCSGIFLLEKIIPSGGHAHIRITCRRNHKKILAALLVDETISIPILAPTNRIPASFQIPADAPETVLSDVPEGQTTWTLWLALPSVVSKFEVPVYRTE
jgi:hypothetical protein